MLDVSHTVYKTSEFDVPAQVLFELLELSGTLVEITRGWISFDTSTFPERWQVGQEVQTRLTAFDFIPLGRYSITFTDINPESLTMRTRERGGLVTHWVHTMTVDEFTDDTCLYTDRVEIKAGGATSFIAAYAGRYYERRHERLKELIKTLRANAMLTGDMPELSS